MPCSLSFVWHDVPSQLGPSYENAQGIRLHDYRWQKTVRNTVARLHAESIRCYSTPHRDRAALLAIPFWTAPVHSSSLGCVLEGRSLLGKYGEFFPDRGGKFDFKRDLANILSRFNPMVLRCLAQADAILVTDEATYRYVRAWWRDKTSIVADIYPPSISDGDRTESKGPSVRLLFCLGKRPLQSSCHPEKHKILPLPRMCSSPRRPRIPFSLADKVAAEASAQVASPIVRCSQSGASASDVTDTESPCCGNSV